MGTNVFSLARSDCILKMVQVYVIDTNAEGVVRHHFLLSWVTVQGEMKVIHVCNGLYHETQTRAGYSCS